MSPEYVKYKALHANSDLHVLAKEQQLIYGWFSGSNAMRSGRVGQLARVRVIMIINDPENMAEKKICIQIDLACTHLQGYIVDGMTTIFTQKISSTLSLKCTSV